MTFGQNRSLWQTIESGVTRDRADGPADAGGQGESCLCVVHRAEEDAESLDDVVAAGRGLESRLAVDVREDLAAALVDPEHARRSVEADRLEVAQQRVDGGCAIARRAPNRLAHADDDVLADVDVAADERNLLHARSIRSSASCSRRRSRSASSIARIVWPIVEPGYTQISGCVSSWSQGKAPARSSSCGQPERQRWLESERYVGGIEPALLHHVDHAVDRRDM